jgi:phosphoglycerate kinase
MLKTLDDYNFSRKRVLVRIDINSPIKDGKLDGFTKLKGAVLTLKELSDKDAKVVCLAHQGRSGREDFISLKQHSEKLSEYLGREVKFVDDIIGERAIKEIVSLDYGEILLLENVRFFEGEAQDKSIEEHENGELVKKLAPLFDVYVNEAFPSCHHSHASIVGFSRKLPSFAGRALEKEVNFLEMVTKDPDKPIALMFGGAKSNEPLIVIKNMIGKVDKVLLSGVLGNLFLLAKGFVIGKETMDFLNSKGHLEIVDELKNFVVAHDEKIETPIDFAFEVDGKRHETDDLPVPGLIKDIGTKTIEKYSAILQEMNTVIVKGPAGVYEDEGFRKGTREMLKAASKVKFSLLGGGHTSDSLEDFGISENDFTHVSLSGGAFIEYLAGKKLPGIEALNSSGN